jgi:hypothetical protein
LRHRFNAWANLIQDFAAVVNAVASCCVRNLRTNFAQIFETKVVAGVGTLIAVAFYETFDETNAAFYEIYGEFMSVRICRCCGGQMPEKEQMCSVCGR